MIQLERKSTVELINTFRELYIVDRMAFEETRIKNNLFLAKIEYLEGLFDTDFSEETQQFRNAQAVMDLIAVTPLDLPEIKTLDDGEIAEVMAKLLFLLIVSE